MEFCKCGSLILNGSCTNKGCGSKENPIPAKSSSKKKTVNKNGEAHVKASRSRKASKVITYNLYDVEEEDRNQSENEN